MSSLLPGWNYIPGTGRKFVSTPSGERVKRQTAMNAFARSFGFRSEYEQKRAMKSEGYQRFINSDRGQREMERARDAGYDSPEARAAFAAYYRDPEGNKHDRSPNGPLAQMLVVTGRRSADNQYAVGETPSAH